MRGCSSFALVQPAVLAVVVVQAAEFQSHISNSAHQPDNFVSVTWFDACAIHPRIYIEKDADRAALPLQHLFFVLGQHGNTDLGKLIRYFAHPPCVCAHHRKGKKHVRSAATARYQQLERGGTLEIPHTPLDQHAECIGHFCGFDVNPPPVGIAAEQLQCKRDV